MVHIAVIGAGITGVTTAYALLKKGYDVTIIEKQRYASMETSFANGGQLSASNAEVWNHWSTVLKGIKWMFRKDAPLLMNPAPSWHKYSWMAEFVANIAHYRKNTIETTRMAIAARQHLFAIAEREGIEFDHVTRGILHIYRDRSSFETAVSTNAMLVEGGLDRHTVTPAEMKTIEPTLSGDFFGGLFTPSDSTGDIQKFTSGLAKVCLRLGAKLAFGADVTDISTVDGGVRVSWGPAGKSAGTAQAQTFDGIVICAGVASRRFAAMVGDRVNIYPVKGYSITVHLDDEPSRAGAPWVSILDEAAKIVSSRLGDDRFRVAGTAEFNGYNRDIRADRIKPLVDWSEDLFPQVSTNRVTPWAGLRPMMPNMMPRVGAGKRPGVFYNTGHGHLGWTLSAATAEAVAQTIGENLPLGAKASTPLVAETV